MRLLLSPWNPPADRLVLAPGNVHLWRVPLDRPLRSGEGNGDPLSSSCLSADEMGRAARLRVPAKAREFTLCRTRLRQILGRYLGLAPGELLFSCNPHGKPALSASHAGGPQFNLAHSGAWMLLAIVAGEPVGIDLERLNADFDFVPIARRYFSPAEQEQLQQSCPRRCRRIFYRLWTRKEAYLKGRGAGFAQNAGNGVRNGWDTRNVFLGRDYVAAVSLRHPGNRVVLRYEWDGSPNS